MKTVKSSIKLQGAGLMFAAHVEVELKPSDKKGIRFFVGDDVIEADVNNVVSCEHCVVIANVSKGAPYKVALIEHFIASLAIAGIDALDVYIKSPVPEIPQFGKLVEMPIFDGSAKRWIEAYNEVGLVGESDEVEPLKETLTFQKDNSAIVIMPQFDNKPTTITYAVNYNHPDLDHRWITLNSDNINEIVEARTFGYLKDLEKFQAAGYSRGVTVENTVGLTDNGYTTELRSQYEPIKHKILDIIGDLYLTGVNPLKLNAAIRAKEAGHYFHSLIARDLKKALNK